MAPQETSAAVDDDALNDDAETAGLDEDGPSGGGNVTDEAAAQAAADEAELKIYLNAGKSDTDIQRELIPEKTLVTLGLVSFDLATAATNAKVKAGKEYFYAKYEVNGPAIYADGSRNFGEYLRCSARASNPDLPQNTAWGRTENMIKRMVACVYQCDVNATRVKEFFGGPSAEAENSLETTLAGRRLVFLKAVERAVKEEIVGKTFPTKIGVDAAREWNGRRFKETQNSGIAQYPGYKERKSAKAAS